MIFQCLNISRSPLPGWTAGNAEPIGVTDQHPFWSVDRKDWIPACELRIGERLLVCGSTTIVERFESRGSEPVYNIEVDVDHCYRVGEQGLLVHNVSDFTYDQVCRLDKANQEVCPESTMRRFARAVSNRPAYRPLVGGLPQGIIIYLVHPRPAYGQAPQVDPPGWVDNAGLNRGHILGGISEGVGMLRISLLLAGSQMLLG